MLRTVFRRTQLVGSADARQNNAAKQPLIFNCQYSEAAPYRRSRVSNALKSERGGTIGWARQRSCPPHDANEEM